MRGNDGDFLQLVVVGLIFGTVTAFRGFKRIQRVRAIQNTGSVPISSSPQGFVELQGFAWQTAPLTSPLTGQNCVYYGFRVEERVKSGKSSHWQTVAFVESGTPFILADETGHVLIHPKGSELELAKDSRKVWNWRSLSVAQQESALEAVRQVKPGFNDRAWIFQKQLRVTEAVIPLGAPLYALGSLRRGEMERLYRPLQGLQLFFRRVSELKGDPVAQRGLDLNGDGSVCDEEWRHGYIQTATARMGTGTGGPIIVPAGLRVSSECYGEMSSSPAHKLFLADSHQELLLKRLSRWNLHLIVAGAGLIGGAAAFAYWQILG